MLTNYIDTLSNDSSDIIKKFRNTLFNSVKEKSVELDLKRRILTLTAPTGLGKTLTSINFALNLRRRIELEKGFIPRVIYVAPFISILDQNWKVFQRVFLSHDMGGKLIKQQTNLLLMHHHLSPINFSKLNSLDEQRNEKFSTSQSELLIQGWNAEIVVTTFIQFFDTVFGRFASQLRRFHNLVGSIVILLEVQCIPFEYWDATRNALLFLAEKFHFTILLMTATKPLIFRTNEAIEIAPDILEELPQRVVFQPRIRTPLKT